MIHQRILFALFIVGLLAISPCRGGEILNQQPGTDPKLKQWLKKFPKADANNDGVLTEQEAREYKQARKAGKIAATPERGGNSVVPTVANVSYGPHERNKLDFWQATLLPPVGWERVGVRVPSNGVTPVLIFFHGGSFKAGDKANVLTRPIFEECLKAGISVVSANYRFSSDAPFPAPMRDGARAVQFVRSKAKDWHLDPVRIALSETSAGATLALWIALHDDLADLTSADPVSRLSTRVRCASPHSGTAGLEPEYFRKQAGVSKLGAALWQLFGAASQAELETPEKRALMREASPLLHATPDDPPLFLTYAGDPSEAPFASESVQKAWIHHVCLGLPLKTKYSELGLECGFYYQSMPPPAGAEIAFLRKQLLGALNAP